MNSVFEFSQYRTYLLSYLQAQAGQGRGLRRRWAEAAGCQPAFISHVLNGSYELSSEQGEAISRFLGHSKEETEYFILLIERQRAGTPSLKKFLDGLLKERSEKHLDLRARMKIQKNLSASDQAIYYSRWFYSAIHMAVTIPALQTPEALEKYFSLPMTLIREVLDFLESHGMLKKKSGRYHIGEMFLHIGKGEAMHFQHQSIWRHKALEAIPLNQSEALHFASCFSIAEKDLIKVREIFSQAIERSSDLIKGSPEEKLYSICLDFFEVK